MLSRIAEMSVHQRALVAFFVLLVGAVGVRAAQRLPVDAVPDVTNVQVQVLTSAPALGPLEVETLITAPVENVMGGLPGLEEIRSVSKLGLSAITIVFEEGTDIYRARQLVAERLTEARDAIPSSIESPEMGPISTGLGEIYQFEVKGDPMCNPAEPDTDACWTPMELRTLLDWSVAVQLRSVRGVVEVNSFGGELETWEVAVDPNRLAARGISLSSVFEALEKNNANAGGATIEHAGEQLVVRGEGLIEDLDDVGRIVLRTDEDGVPVNIADVAAPRIAPMVRQGAVTRDGRGEIVAGIAMMLLGESSRVVAQGVKAKLADVQKTLPKGVTIDTFYDRTELVDRTIHTVAENLIEGAVLVIVALVLFLGNLRAGLLVASAIPFSLLAAFIAMNAFGVSGNLMSLGALDFGLIVDGSVVIVENIVRTLAHRRASGEEVKRTTIDAVKEVARPVAFAVTIIVLVYIPILLLHGIEGKMFRPMAFTVLAALIASLVIALVVMPAFASMIFARGVDEKETFVMKAASRLYAPLLERALAAPKRTLGIATLVLGISLLFVPFLGAEFIPKLGEGALAIQAVRLPSIGLGESVRYTTTLEQVLREQFPDEVATVVSKTGRPEIATDPMGVDLSDIFVILKPPSQWKKAKSLDDLVEQMERVASREVPGQMVSFSQPIELRTNELISGFRSDVAIVIYGDDLDVLKKTADDVVRRISAIDGAADVKAEQTAGLPFLRVVVDRERIARYGINASDVLDAVEAIGGRVVGEVLEGQKRIPLQVRLSEDARDDPEKVKSILVRAPDGKMVPLGSLAHISVEDGPAQISRERMKRRISVEANVRGRDLASFVAEAQQALDDAGIIPPGYFVEWGGQFKNLEAASQQLGLAVPLALVLIFLLLFMTWGSAKAAGLVYLNVPFAASGGIFALALRGMPFSISAGVGFITLFGVAVLNGVVLVSEIREREKEMPTLEACRSASLLKLRPTLMTGIVPWLGFVPMAIATSAGAEVQRPLATVVLGGLITSTFLTLLVLPALYAWLLGPKPARWLPRNAPEQMPEELP